MFIDFYRTHSRLIKLVIVGLVLALVGWLVYYFVFSFHITSITPDPARASYLSPKLEVSFNRGLSADNLKVEAKDVDITYRISDKDTLEINLTSKRTIGREYEITIVSLKSVGGDELRNHVIKLSAVSSQASLTDADRDAILNNQQENKPDILNDPISSLIPYSTLQYSIEPTSLTSSGKIKIKIIIFLSNADVKTNRQGSIDAAKNAALNYLRNGVAFEGESIGVSPDDYVIDYEIREP